MADTALPRRTRRRVRARGPWHRALRPGPARRTASVYGNHDTGTCCRMLGACTLQTQCQPSRTRPFPADLAERPSWSECCCSAGCMARMAARTRKAGRKGSWVRRVAQTSDAMDLPHGIFKQSPSAIAQGLKRSVLKSRRTKGTKFQSAMSMLNLYINRSGRSLSRANRSRLEATKEELRKAFGRKPTGRAAKRTTKRTV
jgi:Protein of unknown function (DUF3175)